MMLALLAVLILAVALPFSLFYAPQWNNDALTLYGILWLCSLKIAHLIYRAEFRPITFTFWIFVYTWGLLAPLIQVSVDKFAWPIFHSLDTQTYAIWLILLAMVCYEAGYIRQTQFKTYARWHLEFSPRKILYLGIIVAAWTIVQIYLAGGPEALMQHRGLARRLLRATVNSQSERIFRDASLHGPIFIHILILAHLTINGWYSKNQVLYRFRNALFWSLAFLLPLHYVANYPNAQTRAWLGALVVAPALLLMPKQQKYIFAFLVGFIVATLIVFPALDSNRSAKAAETSLFSKLQFEGSLDKARVTMIKEGDYDVFQMFCNGIEYVNQQGILWGSNLAGAALFWVPRTWWPDKPIASGTLVGIYFDNPNVNISSPLWMEFYMAFGAFGIVLLMYFYGKFAAYIDNRFQYALETDSHIFNAFLIFAVFWAGQQFLVLRGSLIYAVATASMPILFLLLSTSRPGPATPEGSEPLDRGPTGPNSMSPNAHNAISSGD